MLYIICSIIIICIEQSVHSAEHEQKLYTLIAMCLCIELGSSTCARLTFSFQAVTTTTRERRPVSNAPQEPLANDIQVMSFVGFKIGRTRQKC